MKLSIKKSGVVVSALALALAVPALSAGDAKAQAVQDLGIYGGSGGGGGSAAGGSVAAGGGGGGAVVDVDGINAGGGIGGAGGTATGAAAGGAGGAAVGTGVADAAGGAGGDETVTVGGTAGPAVGEGAAPGLAGAPGTGGAGNGAGGAGGAAAVVDAADATYGSITILGGNGGAGGDATAAGDIAGAGGAGGAASYTNSGVTTVEGGITITGGAAGAAGAPGTGGTGGEAGVAGAANMTVGGLIFQDAANTAAAVTVTAGGTLAATDTTIVGKTVTLTHAEATGVSLGNLTIDGSAAAAGLTAGAGTDLSGKIGNLTTLGETTITNTANLVMGAGSTVNIDLAGVTGTALTIAGGSLAAVAGETLSLNVTTGAGAVYGQTVTIVSNVLAGVGVEIAANGGAAEALAIGGAGVDIDLGTEGLDAAGTATFAADNGAVNLRVGRYITAGDYTMDASVTAEANDVFSVAGNLTLADAVDYTAPDGTTTFKAGTLTVEGASTLTFTDGTAGTADLSAADGNYIGDIVLADGSTFNIATAATTYTWGGDLTVEGAATLTNAMDATGKTLTFGLVGVADAGTALTSTGGLTIDDTTDVVLGNAVLGGTVTLANNVTGPFTTVTGGEAEQLTDLEGNNATVAGTQIELAGTDLNVTFGDTLAAAGDWNLANDLALTGTQGYTVGGTLKLNGNDVTMDDGTTFTAGGIEVSGGDSVVDFTGNLTLANASIGDIVIGDAFNAADGTQTDADGVAVPGRELTLNGVGGTNYNWTGNLTTRGVGNSLTVGAPVDMAGRTLSFELAADTLADGTATALTMNGGNAVLYDSTNIAIGTPRELTNFVDVTDPAQTLVLIQGAEVAAGETRWENGETVTSYGGLTNYLFDVAIDGDSLVAGYAGRSASTNTGAHNYLQGASTGLMLTRSGQDKVIKAIDSVIVVPGVMGADTQGLAFVSVGGEYMEYSTGSDAEVSSFHLMAGPGVRYWDENGQTSLGVFFEAGWGDYDVSNSFAGAAFKGDGDTSYIGGGILARYDTNFGLYGEGSFRAGKVDTNYNANWAGTDYSLDQTYYGGHLGIGYILPVSVEGSIDFSAKGLWTHMNSDSVNDTVGDRFQVDSSDSWRTHVGARYVHTFDNQLSAFIGGTWEYEFDGEVTGRANGAYIDRVDLQGHSGIGELGLTWKATDNIAIGISGFGAFGKRDGGGGNATFSFTW